MADDTQKLAVLIEANTKAYERAMARVAASTNNNMAKAATSTKKMDAELKSLSNRASGLSPVFARMGAAIAAGLSVRQAVQYSEAMKRIQNSLKVAGLAGSELASVQGKLFEAATKNGAPVEALAQLYGKVALVQKELGVSSDDLARFTENVAVALKVSGKSAAESSGALLQLSQALGSGTVRAEEFNSILEGAPTIALAAAIGLEEAGGSVAKLRALMLDGAISSKTFFAAFEAGSPAIQAMAAKTVPTLSQQMENLNTVLIASVGEFDKASGASNALGTAIKGIAGTVESIDWEGVFAVPGLAIDNFLSKFAWVSRAWQQMQNMASDTFGAGTTKDDYAFLNAGPPSVRPANEGLPAGFGGFGGTAAIKTVSVRDNPAAGGGSAGSGSAARSEAARLEAERIDKLRGAYSSASEIIDQMKDKSDAALEKQKALADEISSFAQGLVSDFRNGASAADILLNSLNRIADQLISMATQQGAGFLASLLTGGLTGGASGGFGWTASGGPAFGGPRAVGGPVTAGRAYTVGEMGKETFIPEVNGTIVPPGRGGGGTTINIDARGAQAGVGEEIRRALAEYDRGSYSRHVANSYQGRKRGDLR
jgi:tape measure domain-containing protein